MTLEKLKGYISFVVVELSSTNIIIALPISTRYNHQIVEMKKNMADTIDKRIELDRINTRLSELDREYSKLCEEHNDCLDHHYSDEGGHCNHYGRWYANALNHLGLTEKKESLKREMGYYDRSYDNDLHYENY